MGEVRNMVKWIGGEAFATISGAEQDPVHVDPSMVIAVLGADEGYLPVEGSRRTCVVYITGGLSFATMLGVNEISRALEQAKYANYPPNTGVR